MSGIDLRYSDVANNLPNPQVSRLNKGIQILGEHEKSSVVKSGFKYCPMSLFDFLTMSLLNHLVSHAPQGSA